MRSLGSPLGGRYNCRKKHQCKLCEQIKHKADFPESMWLHRKHQSCWCNDCCRPKCVAKDCKTCKVCRDDKCKRRKCSTAITSLNPKQRPNTWEEVQTYLCPSCRFITCSCGKTMPKKMQKQKGANFEKRYVCVDCQSKDIHQQDTKRNASR